MALPTTSRPLYEAAAAIAAARLIGDEPSAFREFIQLSDDLARERGAVRAALTALAPAPVDSRYDALLAAVAEHYLQLDRMPLPTWIGGPGRVLAEPWFVDDLPALREQIVAETPPAFARHGVYLAVGRAPNLAAVREPLASRAK